MFYLERTQSMSRLHAISRPTFHKFSKNTTSSGGRNCSILSKSLNWSTDVSSGLFNHVTLGKNLTMFFDRVVCYALSTDLRDRSIALRYRWIRR